MEKEGTDHVWLSMEKLGKETIMGHFPNIYQHCLEEGYDVTKECIPVVPAQHYFMGGVWVDSDSKTSMEHLYAVGENKGLYMTISFCWAASKLRILCYATSAFMKFSLRLTHFFFNSPVHKAASEGVFQSKLMCGRSLL